MAKQSHLPTLVAGHWSVTAFKDSLVNTLMKDRRGTALRMYFYAVTNSGWDQIGPEVLQWKRSVQGRRAVLVVGTDHGITDPSALRRIDGDGVEVRLMRRYHGVFHPKVVWLQGAGHQVIWVGSNNLTRDGLLNNIEFALLARSKTKPRALEKWVQSIESGSELLTEDLLRSYEQERNRFELQRGNARAITFTWSKKVETRESSALRPRPGSLIVEVMPRETGLDGKQLQLPLAAASSFFGLRRVGATRRVTLQRDQGREPRSLTMTVFRNNTVRLSVNDLEYRDRPCVIVFEKQAGGTIRYEIVSQNVFPKRYADLLALCDKQTRNGSRRWGIVRRGGRS
jgi:Predicted HKD family nuclease